MREVNIIVAVDEAGGFAKNWQIPWSEPEDLKHFRTVTKNQACVMGRNTYEEIDEYAQMKDVDTTNGILPYRENFVVTSNPSKTVLGAITVPNLRRATEMASPDKEIFVIGGYRLYIEALSVAKKIYMTIVKGNYDCDIFFPLQVITRDFKINNAEEKDNLTFVEYVPK